jgi:hypothetical protein
VSFSKVHIWKKIERLIDYGQRRKMFEVVWSINKNILEATQRCMCKQKKMAVSDTGRWSYSNCFNGIRSRYLEWKGIVISQNISRGFSHRGGAAPHLALREGFWLDWVLPFTLFWKDKNELRHLYRRGFGDVAVLLVHCGFRGLVGSAWKK